MHPVTDWIFLVLYLAQMVVWYRMHLIYRCRKQFNSWSSCRYWRKSPGSMPSHSTSLHQEGAAFKSFLVIESGTYKEAEITKALRTPSGVVGATGTRNLADNLSDLKAQVAANQKGVLVVSKLIDMYGLKVVQAYMDYIQKNDEVAVRDMLKEIVKTTKERTGQTILSAAQFMDDASPIKLKITIDEIARSAMCDFSGTGHAYTYTLALYDAFD